MLEEFALEKESKSNHSIQKVFKIIEILANSEEPLRLKDIAAKAEMPNPTALRIVNTLIGCGYAYQERRGLMRYGLTLKFLQIGNKISDNFSIRRFVHPYIMELGRQCGETCCISENDDNKVRYVDVVESTASNIFIRQRIGNTALMHATSSGKTLLSKYTDQELKAYVDNFGLNKLTDKTITTYEELTKSIEETRQKGYATDDEECEVGMRCIAVPVVFPNNSCYALCLSGPLFRMTYDRIQSELLPKLLTCANNISKQGGDR